MEIVFRKELDALARSLSTSSLFSPPLSWHRRCNAGTGGDCESVNAELLNRHVQFKVSDIYLPDPLTVMSELYGESVLEGRVLDITENDGGARFAVVKVSGLQSPVVIAIEHITGVGAGDNGRRT